jgi:hypothetical protein
MLIIYLLLWILKILFLTVKKVFKSEGINSATAPTMERFTGNESLVVS